MHSVRVFVRQIRSESFKRWPVWLPGDVVNLFASIIVRPYRSKGGFHHLPVKHVRSFCQYHI